MKTRIFYGWWVVAACFATSLFINGIIGFGFTALVEPLSTKYGWSYTQISFATSLRGLEVGVLSPFMGFLIDRWGTRIFVLAGVVFSGLAMLLLSQVSTLGTFYAAFALIAFGMSALSPTVTMTTVANWFHHKQGRATGIMHSGVGFSGLMLPVVVWLIDTYDMEKAMIVLGAFSLVVVAPIALLIRDRPEKYGLLPDGEPPAPAESHEESTPATLEPEFTLKAALRTPAFWLLSGAMLFQLMLVSAVNTHMMPYLTSIDIERAAAGLIAGAVPLTSVLGRLGFGWLADRMDHRYIMAAGYGMMGVGMLFFTLTIVVSPLLLFAAVPIFSIGFGGSAIVRAPLLRNYFGRKSFGAILGLVSALAVVGNLVGAPMAGWVRDTQHSYFTIWLAFAFAAVVPMTCMLLMRKPQESQARAEAARF
jgi:sugar phosphate permease